jgi:hypothetical protein
MSKSDNVTIDIHSFLEVIKGINVSSVVDSINIFTRSNYGDNSHNNNGRKFISTTKSQLSLYLSSISVIELPSTSTTNVEHTEKWYFNTTLTSLLSL